MQKTDELKELINQAASAINLLSAADDSEMENLQALLDQIKQNVAGMSDCPAQLLEQARDTSSNAVEEIEQILRNQTEDTSKSIETISQAILTLQKLSEDITRGITEPESGITKKDTSDIDNQNNSNESEVIADTVIAEMDVPLIFDFINESNEHLGSAEAGLLDLESKPNDKDVINQIFRGFHTIKGMAGFLNLGQIGSLAHSAENLLDKARKDELVLAGESIDIIFETIDVMKEMVGELKDSVKSGKPIPTTQRLSGLLERLKAAVDDRSMAAGLNSPQRQKQDKKLDTILTTANEPKVQEMTSRSQARPSDDKIKVSINRLDNLVNMVGELVVAQLMVTEEANNLLTSEHKFCRKINHQSKIIRELQELSMSMRMVPIHGVFQKMARLVRDLSHKSGKNINFATFGDQTELDRTVVDKITDPLVHMIRNSVDHGIEASEERVKAGKNPTGKIELRAFHEAGNIVIEIEDDGKGLNKERILKKAVSNGIVAADQELSDDEIFKLIFHPGLSTAEKVTSVSGRGVGMDVVKKNVESLHGRIEISSTTGKGTIFTIRMPLTLAIIDGQIINVGHNRYIIPINSIKQSLRPNGQQLSTVQNRGQMAEVQGELIPIIRLYSLFSVVPNTKDPTESLLVVVEDDDRKACLLVDELLGQQQVVIKSLSEGLGKVKGISGGAIMGDGKVSLILDIPGLIELACQM